jgi:hypothetical protein
MMDVNFHSVSGMENQTFVLEGLKTLPIKLNKSVIQVTC